jgi:hypothetical protein
VDEMARAFEKGVAGSPHEGTTGRWIDSSTAAHLSLSSLLGCGRVWKEVNLGFMGSDWELDSIG